MDICCYYSSLNPYDPFIFVQFSENINTYDIFNTPYSWIWCCLLFQWRLVWLFSHTRMQLCMQSLFQEKNKNLHLTSVLPCLIICLAVTTLTPILGLYYCHEYQHLPQSIFLGSAKWFGQYISAIILQYYMFQFNETNSNNIPENMVFNCIERVYFSGCLRSGKISKSQTYYPQICSWSSYYPPSH